MFLGCKKLKNAWKQCFWQHFLVFLLVFVHFLVLFVQNCLQNSGFGGLFQQTGQKGDTQDESGFFWKEGFWEKIRDFVFKLLKIT